MTLPPFTQTYENWAPVLGRVLLGALFLMGGAFKIPGTEGFGMEVAQSVAAGIPFATVAVFLAFVLEIVAGVALVIGWQARRAGLLLALFTLLLSVIFYHHWSDMMQMGMFVSHMGLIAGLLYISVYGARYAAVSRDS